MSKKVLVSLVETDIEEATLRSHDLLVSTRDLGILKDIEYGKEVTKCGQMFHLLTLQGEGQDGVLLTNGLTNIFYIKGSDGKLWAVGADWGDDVWCLFAYPVEGYGWGAGDRVFSR